MFPCPLVRRTSITDTASETVASSGSWTLELQGNYPDYSSLIREELQKEGKTGDDGTRTCANLILGLANHWRGWLKLLGQLKRDYANVTKVIEECPKFVDIEESERKVPSLDLLTSGSLSNAHTEEAKICMREEPDIMRIANILDAAIKTLDNENKRSSEFDTNAAYFFYALHWDTARLIGVISKVVQLCIEELPRMIAGLCPFGSTAH